MKGIWNFKGRGKKYCHPECAGLNALTGFCYPCGKNLDGHSPTRTMSIFFHRHKKCLAAEKAYKNLRCKIMKEAAGICDRSAELEYAKYRLREGDEHRITAEAYEKARNKILEEAGK